MLKVANSSKFTVKQNNMTATVFNQDCLEGMRRLEKGSISVVVTSPPYNLGINYSKYDDSGPREAYLDWLETWAHIAHSALAENGSVFLNMGAKPSDPSIPFQVLERMMKHFQLQNVIHWIKSIAIEKSNVGNYPGITQDAAIGHFKPINSSRFLNDCHEYIFHLTKHSRVILDRLAVGVEYQDKSNIDRWSSGMDKRCRGNTWFVPYKTIRDRSAQRPHPATFPEKIPEMCIRLHGVKRTKLVLDPFLGIGNTALACMNLGVNFVGFEIDEYYSNVSMTRMNEKAAAKDVRRSLSQSGLNTRNTANQ